MNHSNAVYQIACECGKRSQRKKGGIGHKGRRDGHQFPFYEKFIKILTEKSHQRKREFKESHLPEQEVQSLALVTHEVAPTQYLSTKTIIYCYTKFSTKKHKYSYFNAAGIIKFV